MPHTRRNRNIQQPPDERCLICLGGFPAASDLMLSAPGCSHRCCKPCLAGYLTTYIDEPKLDYANIPCPYPSCKANFKAVDTIPNVLPNQQAIVAWWKKVIESTIMDSVGHCPYQDCHGVFELYREPSPTSPRWYIGLLRRWFREKHYAKCYDCGRGICMKCELPWHKKGEKCTSKRQGNWRYPLDRQSIPEEQRLADKLFDELVKQSGWTRCPRCGHVVSKMDGCNFVHCRCGQPFCYRCGSKASRHTCSSMCHSLNDSQLTALRRDNANVQNL